MKDQLVFPLDEKAARQGRAQSSGERGVIDPIVDLDENGFGTHESTKQEKREGHCCTGRDDDIGPFSTKDLPRQAEVLYQVRNVSRRRVVRPVTPFGLEEIMAVRHVERDPESIVVLPPRLENQQMREMSARRSDESDRERFFRVEGKRRCVHVRLDPRLDRPRRRPRPQRVLLAREDLPGEVKASLALPFGAATRMALTSRTVFPIP